MKWEPNEVALEHQGVKVYHLYKYNDMDQGARTYWFAMLEDDPEDGETSFDVRDLEEWKKSPRTEDDIIPVLKAAIESGELKQPGLE